MRSYNSLASQVKNSQLKLTNNLTLGLSSVVQSGAIPTASGSGASDASVNYIYDNFATKTYVDNAVSGGSGGGGGNIDLSSYATKTYVDTSLNSYAKITSLASYSLTSYVDGSLNNIRSNYAPKSAVDASLSGYATTASLSSYATKSAVDVSLSSYSLTTYVDGSLNNIRSNYATKSYVDNSLATVRTDYASYVDVQINQLIGAAPGTLDTLYEIANAIGSDASFSVTVLNKIASSDASINSIRTNYTTNTKFDASVNDLQSQINSVSGSSLSQAYVDGSLNNIRTNYATNSYVDQSLNTNYATKSYVDGSLNTYYATKTYVDGSLNTNYATKSYVDGSLNTNYATKSYVDGSLNTNYATKTYVDGSLNTYYATKTYVDGSLNTNYATKSYVDGSLNTNYATKSYVDGSLNTYYATKSYVDGSLNTNYTTKTYVDGSLNTNYTTKIYVDGSLNNIRSNYATTASLAGYVSSGIVTDVSMNGNVQLGGGNKFVAVNKVPGSTYALDVSGQTLVTGNLAVYKSPSDPSYSYLDMSGVNLNIFSVAEKFVSTTYASATPTFNCTQGTVFAITGITAGTTFTSMTFTNVPAVLNQSVSLTVMLINSAAGANTFFNGTAITLNGTSRTFIVPDATAFTAPSGNRSIVIYQFVVLWVSLASPVVLAYQTSHG